MNLRQGGAIILRGLNSVKYGNLFYKDRKYYLEGYNANIYRILNKYIQDFAYYYWILIIMYMIIYMYGLNSNFFERGLENIIIRFHKNYYKIKKITVFWGRNKQAIMIGGLYAIIPF